MNQQRATFLEPLLVYCHPSKRIETYDWKQILQQAQALHQSIQHVIQQEPNSPEVLFLVGQIKAHQRRSFSQRHQTLFTSPTTKRACLFFLQDLYPEKPTTKRIEQLLSLIPKMQKVVSNQFLKTLTQALFLEVLSVALDVDWAWRMYYATAPSSLCKIRAFDNSIYEKLFAQNVKELRTLQLYLIRTVCSHFQPHTGHLFLSQTLPLMHIPARLMGLTELLSFLERALQAFCILPNPPDFFDQLIIKEAHELERLWHYTKAS